MKRSPVQIASQCLVRFRRPGARLFLQQLDDRVERAVVRGDVLQERVGDFQRTAFAIANPPCDFGSRREAEIRSRSCHFDPVNDEDSC